MNVESWIKYSTEELRRAGIGTARLDSLVLLADVLRVDKTWLLAHPDNLISPTIVSLLDKALEQRQKHIPLAYIRNKAEFYERDFIITKDVLVPRPESEALIELCNKYLANSQAVERIADIGTGSGCIAITIALQHPVIQVIASDASKAALKVATTNAHKHQVDISFCHGNLLTALHSEIAAKTYVIICNLPYVPDNYNINQAAKHEPKMALFGGNDGLALYRELFEQINTRANKPVAIITEALPQQHSSITEIAQSQGYKLQSSLDFGQLFVI